MDPLSNLNPQQHAAVAFGEGPLLIVAGVGTGKTTVITRRIAWLIGEKRALPAEILALTFTERAAAEMEERVDVLVPYGYVEAQIGTFHAFCDRVLRENAVLLGLSPDYRILTEPEQAIFLKEHLFDLPLDRYRPLGNPMRHLRALLTLFSRAKDEDVTPAEYRAHAEHLLESAKRADPDADDGRLLIGEAAAQDELAKAYAAYQKRHEARLKAEQQQAEWRKKLRDDLLYSIGGITTAAHDNNLADTLAGIAADPDKRLTAATITDAANQLKTIATALKGTRR